MSIATRLGKLTPTLTPQQRVVLLLRAMAAGQEPDPAWRDFPDRQQGRTYDRYVALVIVCNNEVAAVLHSLSMYSRHLEQAAEQFTILDQAAVLAEEAEGLPPQHADRHWRRHSQVNVGAFLRGVAAELRHELLQQALQLWGELGGLEEVWQEVTQELGEDPLHPEHRAKADDAQARLKALTAVLAGRERKQPPPSQAFRDEVQKFLDRAFNYLRLEVDK
jgi:hypothetical protein